MKPDEAVELAKRIKHELDNMGNEHMAGKIMIPFKPSAWRIIHTALLALASDCHRYKRRTLCRVCVVPSAGRGETRG